MRNKAALLEGLAHALASGMYEPSTFGDASNPVFMPKKHPVMGCAKQNRIAKQNKRKNKRKK